MFDVAPTELLLLGIVALVVIGPKDLPRAMRFVGKWVARARGMARHFRDGMDEMVRQADLEDMEKKWREENERIMREHPASAVPAPTLIEGEPTAVTHTLPAPEAVPAIEATPHIPHPPQTIEMAPLPASTETPAPHAEPTTADPTPDKSPEDAAHIPDHRP